jgi:hypothetical protein
MHHLVRARKTTIIGVFFVFSLHSNENDGIDCYVLSMYVHDSLVFFK